MPIPAKFGLYAVLTDPVRGYEYLTSLLVDYKVAFVQLRMKTGSLEQITRTAEVMCAITRGSATRFIVNDHPEIAAAVGADGVHVGQDDMQVDLARNIVGPKAIVGLSTHNPSQTIAACAQHPDYIGIGPVYATPTKLVADPVIGLDGMKRQLAAATVPAVCIGGITLQLLPDVLAAGAENFCMVRPLCAAENPELVLKEILRIYADSGKTTFSVEK